MANLETCAVPTYDPFNGWYNYIDGLNNSIDVNMSWNATDYTIGASALTDMAATGMTLVSGVKFMNNTTDDRGLAYLFYDNSVGFYYAVFQYNQNVWGVKGLEPVAGGNRYFNDQESVYFYATDDNLTAIKWLNATFSNPNDRLTGILKFGNSTVYHRITDTPNPVQWDNVTTEGELLFSNNIAGNTITDSMSYDGTSYQFLANDGVGNQDTNHTFSADLYGCGSLTGNVTFMAYEGNTYCGITAATPEIPCTIEGNTYTITASTFNSTSYNATTPSFTDTRWINGLNGVYRVDPFLEDVSFLHQTNDLTGFEFRYYPEHSTRLEIIPKTYVNYDDWLWFLDPSEQLHDATGAYVIRMDSPSGQVNDLNLNNIILDTDLDLTDVICTLFPDDDFTFTMVRGINATTFKLSNVSCTGAIRTNNDIYNNTLNNLLTDAQEQYVARITSINENANEPLWIDYDENTLNRFFLLDLDFDEDINAVYEGAFSFGDNTNFFLNYTVDQGTIQSITSNAVPYGTHAYHCTIPDGYIAVTNATGFVTVDDPFEMVNVIIQEEIVLGLNVSIFKNGQQASHVFCAASTGETTQANIDGVCTFDNGINAFDLVDVFATIGRLNREATFAIGDYYGINSDGTITSTRNDICESFNGVYEYDWTIDEEFKTLLLTVRSTEGTPIENATVYWDNNALGTTNDVGVYHLQVNWNFTNHDLLITHEDFVNYTETVNLYSFPEPLGKSVYLTRSVGSTYDEEYQADVKGKREGDYSELYTTLLSPYALSFSAIAVFSVAATILTANAIIGIFIAFLVMIALVIFEAIPMWIGIIIALVSAAMIGAALIILSGGN